MTSEAHAENSAFKKRCQMKKLNKTEQNSTKAGKQKLKKLIKTRSAKNNQEGSGKFCRRVTKKPTPTVLQQLACTW